MDDLQVARRAVAAGADVALRYFSALSALPREQKADGTVVTAADRDVETAIRSVLSEYRPEDVVLGEEGGETGPTSPTSPRRWIIDPIDGTALFVAGDDRWLVLLALETAGEIVTAVAAIPAQQRVWWATRGGGAFEKSGDTPERRITVAPRSTHIATSRLGVINVRPEVAEPLVAVVPDIPWAFHPALLVARGDLDLALQTNGQIWDFAATSLIVEEAGGRYGTLAGGRRPARGPSLYSAAGPLHDAAIDVLSRARAG